MRLAAVGGVLLSMASSARAANDVSPWDGDDRSAARLIAGSEPARAPVLRAGLEIRLKDGWHTYWRYPGDAGVPPQFDFKHSTNVKDVRVLWPAPRRLLEAGSTTIGYVHDVILPLQVIPRDASKPVDLHLKLAYAVCEKLCVPANAAVDVTLVPGSTASDDGALAQAEAQVPKKAKVGDGQALAIRSAQRDTQAAKPRVLVDVASSSGTPVLFAEGPTPEWALPVPTVVDGASPGLTRFAFDLDGAPPGATYKGALITLTAVANRRAIEVSFRLD